MIRNFLFRIFVILAGVILSSCEHIIDGPSVLGGDGAPILFQALGLDVPTKAIDVTTDNLTTFEATAYPKSTTSSPYFAAATFTGSGNPKVFSASGVNWSNTALDIYAYSTGSASGQLTKIDYKTFTVTPATTADSQMDFVFGCLKGQHFAGTVNGLVSMNFRHTETKVCVNVKNSSSQYRFEVYGWKVCHLDNSATFTHDGSDTRAAGQLPYSCWSNNSSPSVSNSYESNFSALSIATSTFAPVALSGEMMLIPQTTSAATAYQSTSASALPNGSYVAIKMKVIKNSSDAVVFSDGSGGGAWAIWPVGFNWTPGERFTYTIDLSKGAYHEANPISGESSLMSVNDVGLGITVSVGDFNVQEAVQLPAPLSTFGGLMIADAPLYYNGAAFVIKDKDWNHESHGNKKGTVAGSYYFPFMYDSGLGTVSYKGYSDWRIPTFEEMSLLFSLTNRSGSTVNGSPSRHYAFLKLTGVSHGGSTEPLGILFFPDGKIINGVTLTYMDKDGSNNGIGLVNTGITNEQLNVYLSQGCVFIPASGSYTTVWDTAGEHVYLWTSSRRGTSGSNYYFLSVSDSGSLSGVTGWQSFGNSSYCYPVRLVRSVN